jgi:hypothetical protein
MLFSLLGSIISFPRIATVELSNTSQFMGGSLLNHLNKLSHLRGIVIVVRGIVKALEFGMKHPLWEGKYMEVQKVQCWTGFSLLVQLYKYQYLGVMGKFNSYIAKGRGGLKLVHFVDPANRACYRPIQRSRQGRLRRYGSTTGISTQCHHNTYPVEFSFNPVAVLIHTCKRELSVMFPSQCFSLGTLTNH